jgi:ssDNA-binding replication factor A large subunit
METIGSGGPMSEQSFEFDVAFSFLAQDEGLATRLNDLLQGRVRTFIYSERQKELAGKDGEQVFGSVFGDEEPIRRLALS